MGLKILQLISSSGFFGAENVLLELSMEMKALGHSVTVGAFKNLHNPNLELVERARASSIDTMVFECGGRIDLKAVSEIASFVRGNSFDIIHSHGYKSNIYAMLSNMRNRRPVVASCHNWINQNSKMSFYSFLDRTCLKRFDAVVPVSANVRALLIDAGVDERKIHLIGNGVNVKRFHLNGRSSGVRERLFRGIQGPIVGAIGRLTEEKGHIYLLRAARKVLDGGVQATFVIVGGGPLRKRLEDEAETLGIRERVVFTGMRSDIPEILSAMDVFVMPSLTEGQPMALFEAMASGRAIVASRVGDIPAILKDGRLGYLIGPADEEGCAAGILFYLKNPEEAGKRAQMAYNEAAGRYSSERMAREYLKVYNQLLD